MNLTPSDYADLLALQLRGLRLPAGVREYQPFTDRQWRIDIAWPERLVSVECDGGEWSAGRHGRSKGMQSDCDKANRLTLEGWACYRFTGSQVQSGAAVAFLERVLT